MIDIHHGDAVQWARELSLALDLCICPTVAWFAECHKVCKRIGFFVPLYAEETKRNNVMNILANISAMLTSAIVSRNRFSLLRLPVWTSPLVSTIYKLRVVLTNAVSVTTGSRAVFTATDAFVSPAIVSKVTLSAVETGKRFSVRCLFESAGGILTSRRAVFTPSPFEARWDAMKNLFTVWACKFNHAAIIR